MIIIPLRKRSNRIASSRDRLDEEVTHDPLVEKEISMSNKREMVQGDDVNKKRKRERRQFTP